MKNALVLVDSYFPTGVAISSRMLNFCRLFRDAGYKVHVITAHSKGNESVGKIYELDGITYEVVTNKHTNTIESFMGTKGYIKRVKQYLEANSQDFVFMTSSVGLFRRLSRLIKKNHTKCIVEQCEWLDLSTYKFGKLDIRYLNAEYFRREGAKRIDGIISISRLLDKHFNSHGVKSIRIPTILDVLNTPYSENLVQRNIIHVVFAGSLGGSKELMYPIIEALAKNDQFRRTIVFDIYGPSEEQLLTNIGYNQELLKMTGTSVVFHGRIPQEQIPEVYSKSDYLIFVRPQRNSSDAGFPTKFAESMAVGTPVITNDTGDIGLYLRNAINGFMLSDNTTEAICECFNRIVSLDREEYVKMRKAARKTAEESFDYRKYVDIIQEFLGSK